MAIPLGDLIWDLEPVIPYVVGQEIPGTIIVRNDTDIVQTYSLKYVIAKGTTIDSVTDVPVNGASTFSVNPGDTVELFGTFVSALNDGTLTLELIEYATGNIVDSLQATLTPPGGSTLNIIGGPISSGMLSGIIMVMLVLMMMKMMAEMFTQKKSEKKRKEIQQPAAVKIYPAR